MTSLSPALPVRRRSPRRGRRPEQTLIAAGRSGRLAEGALGDTGQMAGDDDVRLPLVLGPVSNGEFLPLAAAPGDVRLARAVLDRAAAAAQALAMDRRLFLQTAGGMAALLTTINLAACTSQAHT